MEKVSYRLLTLVLVNELNNNWDVATILENNHVGHNMNETTQITRTLVQLKRKTILGSHTQQRDKSTLGGTSYSLN